MRLKTINNSQQNWSLHWRSLNSKKDSMLRNHTSKSAIELSQPWPPVWRHWRCCTTRLWMCGRTSYPPSISPTSWLAVSQAQAPTLHWSSSNRWSAVRSSAYVSWSASMPVLLTISSRAVLVVIIKRFWVQTCSGLELWFLGWLWWLCSSAITTIQFPSGWPCC